jgi:hypothetical protein
MLTLVVFCGRFVYDSWDYGYGRGIDHSGGGLDVDGVES